MRTALWLSFFWLWPVAALAGQNTSVYTPFDLEKTCRQVERGDGTEFAGSWLCKGLKGQKIGISIDDERFHVGFGSRPLETCAHAKTFSRFNTALSPVEWRLRNGRPVAVIQRWRVVTDDDGNTATWLVISVLRAGEACPYHYISGSYPDANALARRYADDVEPDFDCAHDTPTVDSKVGADGIDFVSCAEVGAK